MHWITDIQKYWSEMTKTARSLIKAAFATLILFSLIEFLNCIQFPPLFTLVLNHSDSLYGLLLTAAFIITFWYLRLKHKEEELMNDKLHKALNMLGHPNSSTRIIAIYLLGHIMKEYTFFHWTIVVTLVDYIRVHSECKGDEISSERAGRDIEAAIRVLGRRNDNLDPEGSKIDLVRCNLNDVGFGKELDGAKFPYASFHGSSLKRVNMMEAILNNASFHSTDISGASFCGANLVNANFRYVIQAIRTNFSNGKKHIGPPVSPANLRGADFTRAHISGANFEGATLNEVVFHGATCVNTIFIKASLNNADFSIADKGTPKAKPAHLCGADFRGAPLNGAIFKDALYNDDTKGLDQATLDTMTRCTLEECNKQKTE
ncbi:MAG: pentapeptide repeat-containing protein [Candidatus Alcyoniella australis]|nr:pentapeptide repeat-containing protein [Candidatus Alcyoniella australis]